jgi:hypothetical protein
VGLALSVVAFFVTYYLARKSIVKGVCATLTIGCFFGIVRANFPQTASFFIFDSSVVALYVAQHKLILRSFRAQDGQRLQHWIMFLMFWPLLMFLVPMQDPMVQLVGLRGNVFLLPFVLIGAQLENDELFDIALWLAVLCLISVGVGTAEYLFGIEHFFPENAVTDIIYRSNDVGADNAYRIPSMFPNAHTFGGMMVMALPWMVGAWIQRQRLVRHKNLLVAGIIAAMLGVFMSAARTHFIILVLLITVFTFSTRLRPIYRVGWVLVLVIVGFVVSSNPRFQRFTTLTDRDYVSSRVESSVNVNILDAVARYPFGIGLGGGGTSMPFFLVDKVKRPIAVESELGRIHLETGLIGMVAWLGFTIWVFTRPRVQRNNPWFVGLRLGWVTCLVCAGIGLIGIGLLTSIPSSAVLLMLLGWIAVHHTRYFAAPMQAATEISRDTRTMPHVREQGASVR